jgi:hypothetical protein
MRFKPAADTLIASPGRVEVKQDSPLRESLSFVRGATMRAAAGQCHCVPLPAASQAAAGRANCSMQWDIDSGRLRVE